MFLKYTIISCLILAKVEMTDNYRNVTVGFVTVFSGMYHEFSFVDISLLLDLMPDNMHALTTSD